MGVPALFRWLSQKYPKIVSGVVEDRPLEVDGNVIPVDITKSNPNGEEFDNLYLDMNGIVHPCSHPDDKPPPADEEEMMLEVFKYTDRVVNMVRPRRLLMIAVAFTSSDGCYFLPDSTVIKGDGVAPRAKMNQQRSRRFRAAQEAKEKDEDKEEFIKMLRASSKGEVDEEAIARMKKKTWDSNSITPGTPFMDLLASCLRYWVSYKINTDPGWEQLKVIISDATVPGEGEHKIMEFIRSQRSSPEHDPNTRHVIYGLDADLIMLGLATHEPHFRVLREDVFAQESSSLTCRLCGQKGHKAFECKGEAKVKSGEYDEKDKPAALKPFIWLHVSVLREYLAAELQVPNLPFKFDLERALDDWVFMCFFVGNDFLPHLPSLDIRENGIDTLIAIWRDNLPIMGGYLTKDGHVDLARAQVILQGLAKQEDAIFKRRRETDVKREANAKRRKLNEQNRNGNRFNGRKSEFMSQQSRESASVPALPLFKPTKGELNKEAMALTHDIMVNRGAIYQATATSDANKSAAAVLKDILMKKKQNDQPQSDQNEVTDPSEQSALGKRKADLLVDEESTADSGTPGRDTPVTSSKTQENEPPVDTVRLWEEGYADRYYEQKFHADPNDVEFRHTVARAYVEGLAWVLLYYFQGCPSWTWYYPYHYAPFAADFVDIDQMELVYDKGAPFKPFEQLMGVMPAASAHVLPEVFHGLMKDEDSEIIDFYPETFPLDLNGKKFAWQGVALLPFIDEKRLLTAMRKKYPLLTKEEAARNEMGKEVLVISDKHPLYEDIAKNFYSKRQGQPVYTLNPRKTQGLSGVIEKNEDYIPQSALTFPLNSNGMPNLEDDHSISVNYEMPKSNTIHKSMILRGVVFSPPKLDQADIHAVKNRAQHSGRSYGGVPFSNNKGHGGRHNNQINFAVDRPNPFAAHLDPNFNPQFAYANNNRGPPPPSKQGGWNPPRGNSYSQRNSSNEGFSYGYSRQPQNSQGWSGGYNPQGSYNSSQGSDGYYSRGNNPNNRYGRGNDYGNDRSNYGPRGNGNGYGYGVESRNNSGAGRKSGSSYRPGPYDRAGKR